jgi:DNA-3-methyladenine glycosylase
MPPAPLPESFYLRPTLDVARDLLGRRLHRRLGRSILAGRIVEVEAYHQDRDEASHAFRGRSPRNEVMFHRGGCLYVYFTYGMHFCMNIVTEDEGIGAAVLIRALEPLQGLPAMRRLRGDPASPVLLTGGPARCCQAFAVNRAQNGALLQGPEIWLSPGEPVDDTEILATQRIGIRSSRELPWRFILRASPWLSRPAPRLR